jgi:hypothetical protein
MSLFFIWHGVKLLGLYKKGVVNLNNCENSSMETNLYENEDET